MKFDGDLEDMLTSQDKEEMQNCEFDDSSLKNEIITLVLRKLNLPATDRTKVARTVAEALDASPDESPSPHKVAQRLISAFQKTRNGGQRWSWEEEKALLKLAPPELSKEWENLRAASPAKFEHRSNAALLKKWHRLNQKNMLSTVRFTQT